MEPVLKIKNNQVRNLGESSKYFFQTTLFIILPCPIFLISTLIVREEAIEWLPYSDEFRTLLIHGLCDTYSLNSKAMMIFSPKSLSGVPLENIYIFFFYEEPHNFVFQDLLLEAESAEEAEGRHLRASERSGAGGSLQNISHAVDAEGHHHTGILYY